MIANKLKIGKKLGQGGYGAVYEAKTKNNQTVAVKEIKIDKYGIPNIIEMSLMTTFKHPNINRALDVFVEKNKLYLVQEKGISDLVTYTEKYKQHDNIMRQWFFYLLDALNTLHKNHIIHGDLKAENILLFPGETVKITDFSCSVKKWSENSVFTHVSGTSTHRAPEGVLGLNWNEKFDVWALGCTFYQIFYGYPLFRVQPKGPNRKKALINALSDWQYFSEKTRKSSAFPELIKNEQIEYKQLNLKNEYHRQENKHFNQLLSKMLTTDPDKRYSCQQLMSLPYFDGVRIDIRYTIRCNKLQKIESKKVLFIDKFLRQYTDKSNLISHATKLFRSCRYLDGPETNKLLACFYISLKIFNQDVNRFFDRILPLEELLFWEQSVCQYLSYRLH